MGNCGGDNGSRDWKSCSFGGSNSSNERRSQPEIYLVILKIALIVQKTAHFLYFSCISLTAVKSPYGISGHMAYVNKYLLNWLFIPRNPLVPSSHLFYLFISRKDLQYVALFICALIHHPATPLKSSPRKQFSQLSRTERWSFSSPLQQGNGVLLGENKNANNWIFF